MPANAATGTPRGQTLRPALLLVRRGLNEILRVPGASIPGVISPAIFLLGLTFVFGRANRSWAVWHDETSRVCAPNLAAAIGGFTGGARA